MQITDLRIRNFKSIKDMHISGIENALILVGQNDTGKRLSLMLCALLEGIISSGKKIFGRISLMWRSAWNCA